MQDDAGQATAATQAFARLTTVDPGYLTTVVLAETYWVLTRAYGLEPDAIFAALENVIAAEGNVLQDASLATEAIHSARSGADFADALIAAACEKRGCGTIVSFDQRAQRTLGFSAP